MTNMATNRGLIFTGDDFSRPRMAVESDKIKRYFPNFSFYASGETVKGVKGYLKTSDGNSYYVSIEVDAEYPYKMPIITLPETAVESNCPHRYTGGNLCVMMPEQWSSTYSLAFMVAKAAIWVNKYDIWKRTGKWPGKEQQH